MIRKYLLPMLALLGVVIIIIVIVLDNRPKRSPAPPGQWPDVPFASYVSGAGVVEASNGNSLIGTAVSGMVVSVYVHAGDRVATGDRLFKIDDREIQAQRVSANAGTAEAKARWMQSEVLLRLAESVPDQRAVSREEISLRRSAVAIAAAALQLAETRAAQIDLATERFTVRAVQPGKVLQMNLHAGEFVQSGGQGKPLLLIGDIRRLYVRADIDEFDAFRVAPGAAGVAFVRGAPQRPVQLTFERIEPYIGPKTALLGTPTERVDSRVLQVIYSFDASALPVYVGQQMDVYIQTAPSSPTKNPTPSMSDHSSAASAS